MSHNNLINHQVPLFFFKQEDAWYSVTIKSIFWKLFRWCISQETINCHFHNLYEKNFEWLTDEQLCCLDVSSIEKTRSTALALLRPQAVEKFQEAQLRAYFKAVGFANLDGFSPSFQQDLIDGNRFPLEKGDIQTLPNPKLLLFRRSSFLKLSANGLKAFTQEQIASFPEYSKMRFIMCYFVTLEGNINFDCFEPAISKDFVIDTLVHMNVVNKFRYAENLETAQLREFMSASGFKDVFRFSSSFRTRLVNGEIFDLEARDIASFSSESIKSLKPKTFAELSPDALSAWNLEQLRLFSDKQKAAFVRAYFNVFINTINFKKFSPAIPKNVVINAIELTPQHIEAFDEEAYGMLHVETINRLPLDCIKAMDHEHVKSLPDFPRATYFARFNQLDRQAFKEAWMSDPDFGRAQQLVLLRSMHLVSYEEQFVGEPSTVNQLGRYEVPEYRIGFINGICNSKEGAMGSADYISRLALRYNVHYVHNQTHGIISDLRECAAGLQGNATDPVQRLHEMWDAYFQQFDFGDENLEDSFPSAKPQPKPFLMFCHSQGAIHTGNALLSYCAKKRQLIHVVAVAPGGYIDRNTCGQVTHYRVGATYDPVPALDMPGYSMAADQGTVCYLEGQKRLADHQFKSEVYGEVIAAHIERYLPKSVQWDAFTVALNSDDSDWEQVSQEEGTILERPASHSWVLLNSQEFPSQEGAGASGSGSS